MGPAEEKFGTVEGWQQAFSEHAPELALNGIGIPKEAPIVHDVMLKHPFVRSLRLACTKLPPHLAALAGVTASLSFIEQNAPEMGLYGAVITTQIMTGLACWAEREGLPFVDEDVAPDVLAKVSARLALAAKNQEDPESWLTRTVDDILNDPAVADVKSDVPAQSDIDRLMAELTEALAGLAETAGEVRDAWKGDDDGDPSVD